jgi:hypothetical protein
LTLALSVSHQRVVQAAGFNSPDDSMWSRVLDIASNSRTDDDSVFSESCSSVEKENSAIPSMEYDATAKSEALLAIMAFLSCVLLAGIFLSSNAVASKGRMEERAMPVCHALIGWPFQSPIRSPTSLSASIVSSSSLSLDSKGFLRLLVASETSVAMTTAIVAKRVPTKTDFPQGGFQCVQLSDHTCNFPNLVGIGCQE